MAYVKRTIAAGALGLGIAGGIGVAHEAARTPAVCHDQPLIPSDKAWCGESFTEKSTGYPHDMALTLALLGTSAIFGTSIWIAAAEREQRRTETSQNTLSAV